MQKRLLDHPIHPLITKKIMLKAHPYLRHCKVHAKESFLELNYTKRLDKCAQITCLRAKQNSIRVAK
uniref:Uncharacterized protein LOC107646622 n=1 Tax=Rhizophora mucronata TaxID=61149 RepID=A0A2P2PIX7_RHIMU